MKLTAVFVTSKTAFLNGRYRARTCDPLIKSQLHKNSKDSKSKDLEQEQLPTVAPAYKQNPKTAENEPAELPSDLAEIVAVWPELPENIKVAIRALIQTGGK
ncbi:hypothetical protein ACFL3G_00685 [Planctomycetota bacterium]